MVQNYFSASLMFELCFLDLEVILMKIWINKKKISGKVIATIFNLIYLKQYSLINVNEIMMPN